MTETARVLQTKFDWTEDKVRQAIHDFSETATVLRPRPSLHLLKYEPDNRILECAVAAHAQLIVTGDRRLLALKQHGDRNIIPLAGFLTLLKT